MFLRQNHVVEQGKKSFLDEKFFAKNVRPIPVLFLWIMGIINVLQMICGRISQKQDVAPK
jgi:hypothetical protein